MAHTTTDAVEAAVLSGAIFAGRDPDGSEPHRRSSSSRDSSAGDSSDDEGIGFVNPSDATEPPGIASETMPTKAMSHNTGVKGVLADYREHQRQDSRQLPSINALKGRVNPTSNRRTGSAFASSEASSSGELSDGEQKAKELYRQKRMNEVLKMGSGERRTMHNAPKFGHLREIGQDQFVKATDELEGTTVIVHVYDPVRPSFMKQTHKLSA